MIAVLRLREEVAPFAGAWIEISSAPFATPIN